ncbi:hypothetical protein V8C43DRAFT_273440, partial [Trichoderma afarasin]
QPFPALGFFLFFFFQPSWFGLRRTTKRSLPGAKNPVAWRRGESSIWLGPSACHNLNITHQINQEGMHIRPLAWALSDMTVHVQWLKFIQSLHLCVPVSVSVEVVALI